MSRGTTPRMVALFQTTVGQLKALNQVATPQAHRHPAAPVPPMVEADARALLGAARRVLSREPGQRGRLELRGPLSWAELEVKVALAFSGFNAFKARYHHWDSLEGDYVWNTTDTLPVRYPNTPATLVARATVQLESQITALEQQV